MHRVMKISVCVCVCVCAYAHVCVCVCVRVGVIRVTKPYSIANILGTTQLLVALFYHKFKFELCPVSNVLKLRCLTVIVNTVMIMS